MAERDLLMVVPSRGRPQNLARLLDALRETCKAGTDLLVGLDTDDPLLGGYVAQWPYVAMGWLPGDGACGEIRPAGKFPYDVKVRSGLRQVGAWLNELSTGVSQYTAIGHFGDDNLPLTVGWDERILEALQITPFAFGNDLYPREPGSLPCHIFMRSEVIGALGYMAPPGYRHMVDLAWLEWGRACGMTFLEDVIIEHLHWSNGKASMDDTYRAVNGCTEADSIYHGQYCAGQLQEDVCKIKAAAAP